MLKHHPLELTLSLSPSLSHTHTHTHTLFLLLSLFLHQGQGLYFTAFQPMDQDLQNKYVNHKSRHCFTSDFPHLLIPLVVIPEAAIRTPKNPSHFPFMSYLMIIHVSSEISSEIQERIIQSERKCRKTKFKK